MWPETVHLAACDKATNDIGMSCMHNPWQDYRDPAGRLALGCSNRSTRNQGRCLLVLQSELLQEACWTGHGHPTVDDFDSDPNHKRWMHQQGHCKCGARSSHPVDLPKGLLGQFCHQRATGHITRWKWKAHRFPVSGSHWLCVHVLMGRSCELQRCGGLWRSSMEHEVQEVLGHASEQQGGSSLND